MTVANFVKALGRGIQDRTFNVVSPQEWLEILNFQSGELYPEIGVRTTTSALISTLTSEYQVDLSALTNLEEVIEVFVDDASGNKFLYDNWIHEKEAQILDLDPESSKAPSRAIANYTNYHIIWAGYLPEFVKTSTTISLSPAKLVLFKKICTKEALYRILNDHAKLDRYRTLVGSMNEYALLAMVRDLSTEIEIKKRKLVDTHPVRSF